MLGCNYVHIFAVLKKLHCVIVISEKVLDLLFRGQVFDLGLACHVLNLGLAG